MRRGAVFFSEDYTDNGCTSLFSQSALGVGQGKKFAVSEADTRQYVTNESTSRAKSQHCPLFFCTQGSEGDGSSGEGSSAISQRHNRGSAVHGQRRAPAPRPE